MTTPDVSEELLATLAYSSCAMATDGGSIAVVFLRPDGASLSLVLDRQVGSATTDRLCLDGDREALIEIDQEGPWLELLRRVTTDGSITDAFELDLVSTVRDVIARRHP